MTTMNTELNTLNQSSALVELYVLDCTSLGGSVYRFTPHFADGGSVSFGGNVYMSIPIKTEGWEVTATGTQPRPTLAVSNVNQTLLNAVQTLGDIVGAKLMRIRTMAKFLDGEPGADANQFLQPDIFFIEQKVSHTKEMIAWQLSSVIDRFGTRLPRRQITRDLFPGVGRSRGTY